MATLENPFLSQFMRSRQAGPFFIVIFGASGDLTKRKLIPALFNLFRDGYLPERFGVFGYARREKTDQQFREEMAEGIRQFSRRQPDSDEQLQQFLDRLEYVTGDLDDEKGYRSLRERLRARSLDLSVPQNILLYMATPPDVFEAITRNVHRTGIVSGISDGDNWSRLIIEKPFGHDTTSAWQLNGALHRAFSENQIYRIDHYLGKETVQNILVFRLGNAIFEPLWNRQYIDHVQISVAESIGIGSRAGYFEQAGMIRDMVQSHILQVFTLIAMEPPTSFQTNAIRDEKAKVLKSLIPLRPNHLPQHIVRGQYHPGSVGGEQVRGYREENGVSEGSMTETYCALQLHVDNWRWAGVPFYIRTGKRLPKRVSEVSIVFKSVPKQLFDHTDMTEQSPNVLRLRIQPQEGISLSLGAKVPGQSLNVSPVRMDFTYSNAFGMPSPEAYERLILDAITGDSTLFAREDEVELSWQLIDSITKHWEPLPLHPYAAGAWGPQAADELLGQSQRRWLRL